MSADAHINLAFGVAVDACRTPWFKKGETGRRYGWEIAWWRTLRKFEPSFCPFTPDGQYKDGVTGDDPRVEAYRNEEKAFEKANPQPFEVENLGDYYPYREAYDPDIVLVCAPESSSSWDSIELDELNEVATLEPEVEKRFREFLADYFPEEDEPKWILWAEYS